MIRPRCCSLARRRLRPRHRLRPLQRSSHRDPRGQPLRRDARQLQHRNRRRDNPLHRASGARRAGAILADLLRRQRLRRAGHHRDHGCNRRCAAIDAGSHRLRPFALHHRHQSTRRGGGWPAGEANPGRDLCALLGACRTRRHHDDGTHGLGRAEPRRLALAAGDRRRRGGRNEPRRRPRRSRHRSAWRTVRHDPIKRHESHPYRRLRADGRAWRHRHHRRAARSPAAGAALMLAHPIFHADPTEGTGAMNTHSPGSIYVARSLPAALDALHECGSAGAPFAGGTWIMRSPIRHEAHKPHYVAIGKVPELTAIRIDAEVVEIGAAVTHAALASALTDLPEFDVLATAAGRSANPAIRAMATIGGNLSTSGFAAADCVPALLCLDAEVDVCSRGDQERVGLARFLRIRPTLEPGRLLTRIILPRRDRKTAHARLPLRKSGDYPAAIVSLAVSFDAAARVQAARIAVGSVEPVARRWERLEAALVGPPLNPALAAEAATELADEFTGRDSVDMPAWYRVSVLPSLVRRAAVAALKA